MKKYLFCILCVIFLSSCGPNQNEVEQAKQEMLGGSGEILESYIDESLPLVDIQPSQEGDFLRLDPIDSGVVWGEEVKITGQVLNPAVEKIIVNFNNSTSSYPSDQYTLKEFVPGDPNFTYIASSKFRVLDYGTNEYTFVAYASGSISETKMIIDIPKNPALSSSGIIQNTTEILTDLPKSTSYGEPIFIGDETFTYSQIKGLEVKKESVPFLSCTDASALTDFFVNRYGYAYWNTCRDIVAGRNLRVNVVRLTAENTFLYETHIIDSFNQLYATYFLASGSGSKENLESKNTEFKSQEQKGLGIVQTLFTDLAR